VRSGARSNGTAALTLVGVAAAVMLLHAFRSILWPFALALVITILIQAFIRAALRIWPGANRRAMLMLAGAAALGLLFALTLIIVPGVAGLGRSLPAALARLDSLLVQASGRVGLETPLTLQVMVGQLDVRTAAAWTLAGLRGFVSGVVLTALFVIFQLISWELIQHRIRFAGGRGLAARVVLERSVRGVESYLWIQTLTGLMNAGAAGLVMFAVGLSDWALWAVALFLLSFIPFLGVAVGSVGPALSAMLQFPSIWPSLVIFLSIQAVAFVVGNLVTPKLQATNQNIDPCAGLLAVGSWSVVWGLPGAFLAIPLTLALIYQLAGTRELGWIAILLSNDGVPLPRRR
jgi:AI-2 transport protein TqsA